MNKPALLPLAIVLMLTINSCSIFKSGAHKKHTNDTTTAKNVEITPTVTDTANIAKQDTNKTIAPATANPLQSALVALYNHPIIYTTFSGKAKMKYGDANQSHDFSANFRIRKDSVIWVMVTAFGGMVQVARAVITPDSIRVVNYLSKEVILMPLSRIAQLLPVPVKFASLQNMIIGNALVEGQNPVSASDLGALLSLQLSDDSYNQQLDYNKADSTLKTEQLTTRTAGGTKGDITYEAYGMVANRKFSNTRTIIFTNKGMQYVVNMDFTSADFDQPLEYPFSIPSSFSVKQQ